MGPRVQRKEGNAYGAQSHTKPAVPSKTHRTAAVARDHKSYRGMHSAYLRMNRPNTGPCNKHSNLHTKGNSEFHLRTRELELDAPYFWVNFVARSCLAGFVRRRFLAQNRWPRRTAALETYNGATLSPRVLRKREKHCGHS